MKNYSPSEAAEQVRLVNWMKSLDLVFHHSPNGTYTSSIRARAKNKAMGVSRGFPDILVMTKSGMIFVELKRRRGSTTSPEQVVWIELLNEAGYPSTIARGFDEAKAFIEQYI